MDKKMCSVGGCIRSAVARGWCENHYRMWKRHGDPCIRGTAPGEVQAYLHATALSYEGDECLFWPFSKSGGGYGTIRYKGRIHNVSRVVCELAHGAPPTRQHEAAHSCGNGHLGCVAKRHVSWKTPEENTQDKLMHGTVPHGAGHSNAKLNEETAARILGLRGTLSQSRIAEKFGVTQTLVSRIHRGAAWKHVLAMELNHVLSEPLDAVDMPEEQRIRVRETY